MHDNIPSDVPDTVLSKQLSVSPFLGINIDLIYYSHYFQLCETPPLYWRGKLKYIWVKSVDLVQGQLSLISL